MLLLIFCLPTKKFSGASHHTMKLVKYGTLIINKNIELNKDVIKISMRYQTEIELIFKRYKIIKREPLNR